MLSLFHCSLALLALINPISKIFIVSTLAEGTAPEKIRRIAIKATGIAAGILLTFALVGNFLLNEIFQVEIYSFQMVGGMILFFRGFQALNNGLFFEVEAQQRLEDASIVPLASPMIAGPATIAAAVSFPPQYGIPVTLGGIAIAVTVNLIVMLYAQAISDVLKRNNLMGALVRITGLIVATIGMQMVLDGLQIYIALFVS